MTPIANLLKISRPGLWVFSFSVVRLGMRCGGAEESVASIALQVAATFPLCLWTCGWNDLFDRASDAVNPRKGGWFFGPRLRPEWEPRLRRILWGSLLAPAVACWVLPAPTAAMLIAAFALTWVYSVPPLRLKEVPLGDGASCALTLGALFAAGFSLGKPLVALPTEVYFFLPAIAGFHFYTTLMDEECDRRAGYRIVAVLWGPRPTAWLSLILTSVPLLVFLRYPLLVQIVLLAQLSLCVVSFLLPRAVPVKWAVVAIVVLAMGELGYVQVWR